MSSPCLVCILWALCAAALPSPVLGICAVSPICVSLIFLLLPHLITSPVPPTPPVSSSWPHQHAPLGHPVLSSWSFQCCFLLGRWTHRGWRCSWLLSAACWIFRNLCNCLAFRCADGWKSWSLWYHGFCFFLLSKIWSPISNSLLWPVGSFVDWVQLINIEGGIKLIAYSEYCSTEGFFSPLVVLCTALPCRSQLSDLYCLCVQQHLGGNFWLFPCASSLVTSLNVVPFFF